MAAENRFVVFVLNGIEGILKDNATTQKCSKKWLRFLTIINLSTICLTI